MFLLTPWLIAKAVLFVLGVWWCVEMFPRWREDLGKFGPGHDWSDRGVVIALWIATTVIGFGCVRFLLGAVGRIVEVMR